MKVSSSQSGSKVLIVDDNHFNLTFLKKSLERYEYEVTTAGTGREALDLLVLAEDSPDSSLSTDFDAVILDIKMPEIDGLTVLRELREVKSPVELPVIIATVNDQSEDIVESFRLGANDYVVKPIDLLVLQARLETHIQIKHTHRKWYSVNYE